MNTNRDKFLMRVKLHISFFLFPYLFSCVVVRGRQGEIYGGRLREADFNFLAFSNFVRLWPFALH